MKVLVITRELTLPEVLDEEVEQIQAAAGEDAEVVVTGSPGEAVEHALDAEIILGMIEQSWLAKMQNLKWLQAAAAGVDVVLFPEFVESEIILTGEKGIVGDHLGDHAFALLLALSRSLKRAWSEGPASWDSRIPIRRASIELTGKTAGIVGLGGVGKNIARKAVAFGMNVIAVDLEDVEKIPEVSELRSMEHFHDLLARSDVVFVGLPLTDLTRNIFSTKEFEVMKPTSLIINVTRGPIIDDVALTDALKTGKIAGAGLDVVPIEPLPADHPYWTLPNIVMTPHTAGGSPMRARRNIRRFIENIKHYRAGEPLEGLVDKRKGF